MIITLITLISNLHTMLVVEVCKLGCLLKWVEKKLLPKITK